MSGDGASGARRVHFFGTYDRSRVSRITALIDGLRAGGLEVVECNKPLRLGHEARVGLMRKPWRLPLFAYLLVHAWWGLLWRSRALPKADFVVVPYMGQFDVLLARLRFPGTPVVLDQMVFLGDTIRDRRGPVWLAWLLQGLDWVSMAAANVIMLDTDEHLELVPLRFRGRATAVPVGVAQSWWSAGREHLGRPSSTDTDVPSLVFFGLFTPLQGTAVLAAALKLLDERGVPFRATLIGRGQDRSTVRQLLDGLDQICWVDWLDEDALRETVARHDICLGIFGATPKALRVVPQKVPMGAAAGCALVTSDTPPQRRAFDGAALFVQSGDAQALADGLEALLGDVPRLRALQAAAFARARELYGEDAAVRNLLTKLGATSARNHFSGVPR